MDKEKKIGIILGYFNIIINTVANFVYVPLLLYYVGKNEYGIYQLIGSLIAYVSLMDFGLNSSIITFYTKYKSKNDVKRTENLLAIGMRLYVIITIIILLIGIVIYYILPMILGATLSFNELIIAKQMFILLLINVIITITTLLFSAVINANEKFIFFRGLTAVQLIIQPLCVVAIISFYNHVIVVAVVQTIFNIILAVIRIYYVICILHVKISFHGYDLEMIKPLLRLSFTTFVVAVVDQIFFKTNQIIIGILSGPEEVAVYSVSALIYMGYMQLSSVISGVFVPKMTMLITLRENMKKISNLFIKVGSYQCIVLSFFLTGFILFGKKFIIIWAGNDFLEAYYITLIILFPFTIDLIQNIGLTIMQAKNSYGFRARVYVTMGILNLILAYILCPIYDAIGCAMATGISMFIGNGVIMNLYYYKILNVNIMLFWKKIVILSLNIFVYTIIIYILNSIVLYDDFMYYLLKILIWTSGFFILLYFKCFNKQDRKNIINFLLKH